MKSKIHASKTKFHVRKKAILITGTPGTGKTTLESAIWQAHGFSRSTFLSEKDIPNLAKRLTPDTQSVHIHLTCRSETECITKLEGLIPFTRKAISIDQNATVQPLFIITSQIKITLPVGIKFRPYFRHVHLQGSPDLVQLQQLAKQLTDEAAAMEEWQTQHPTIQLTIHQ